MNLLSLQYQLGACFKNLRLIFLSCTNLVCIIIAILCSCTSRIEVALDSAGENRQELAKVLEYFENDPNRLKYESAVFLIENMAAHYTYQGKAVDDLDDLFIITAQESINKRTDFYNSHARTILLNEKLTPIFDITSIKADFLIKAIDDACEMWCNTSWHTQYKKDIFFNYVLPYRLEHEPLSDWRKKIKEEFPLLSDSVVLTRRGVIYEAEKAECNNCNQTAVEGASNGSAEILDSQRSSISFAINTERNMRKRLIIKYSAPRQVKVQIRINDHIVDTLFLAPSRNELSFTEKWLHKSYSFKKGVNSLTINETSDSLCIDYIQLGAIEPIKPSDIPNLSTDYYLITNMKSGKLIAFDTTMVSKTEGIELVPYNKSDKKQIIRLESEGYPLWKVACSMNRRIDACLEMAFGTSRTLSPDSIVTVAKYENRPFMQWVFFPVGNDNYRIMNKHTGMFLDTRTDGKKEYLVQNPYSKKDSQIWILKKHQKNPHPANFFKLHSPISEAMRVLDITHSFEYYIHDCPFLSRGSSLFKAKSGKCADETAYSVLLCRYLGIPSAYDFTPHWGNRTGSHSWSVLIDEKGKTVPFYMGNMPGDTAHFFYSYLKPKVFRYRYRLNEAIINDLKFEQHLPSLFVNPIYIDVTDEYYTTTDVIREVPDEYNNRSIAYICVFDNRDWVPVYYGKIKNGKVNFKSMGRGIVYMAGTYDKDHIVPFGNPFLITQEGKIKEIKSNKRKRITMELHRKYPFMGAKDFFNSRMDGGQFQGANESGFSDCVTLYTHKGITNGNWYKIPIKNDTPFQYLRYVGGRGSFCNINELEFYDNENQKIEGKIIGTQGESWCPKENVFDGDILTGFGGLSPDGNWVGLKLQNPTPVSEIRYIGRNDGNGIEKGDTYELYCWNEKGYWELITRKTATDNILYFHNIQSNGLFVLRDITKGVEERIFTYEKGRQVWW